MKKRKKKKDEPKKTADYFPERDRITINPTFPYHEDASKIRSIKGVKFRKKEKQWFCPFSWKTVAKLEKWDYEFLPGLAKKAQKTQRKRYS